MIVKYLRKEDNKPYACFVSTGRGKIGMSFCNPEDRFIKTVARGIALSKEVEADESINILMDKIEDYAGNKRQIGHFELGELMFFNRRINKYFKEDNYEV